MNENLVCLDCGDPFLYWNGHRYCPTCDDADERPYTEPVNGA